MAKRATITEGLSSKEMAFLKGGAAKEQQQASKLVNLQESKPTEEPSVALEVRIPKSLMTRLQKCAVNRKTAGLRPATQQDIVIAALVQWMDEHE
jgi:hypothetical protein